MTRDPRDTTGASRAANESIELFVDGERLLVSPGSSVAAALLTAGIDALRRSERGAPRSAVCGMGVCFECRLTINGVAHQRSCLVTVRTGMQVTTSGGRSLDRGAHD